MKRSLPAMSAIMLVATLQGAQAHESDDKPQATAQPVSKAVEKGTPAPAQADQKDKKDITDLDIGDLMKVEVTTASKKAQPLSAVPSAIYVITNDDIRRSGANNIPEALRLAPGVQVGQIDNQRYSVSIRGFSGYYSGNLLVLIDGRCIYNPLFAGVFWEQQFVMLEDVDRIEVIRGPGGALWGANAVDGIINIITKPAKETQKSLLVADVGDRLWQGEYRYGGQMGKNDHYRVYAMNRTQSHLNAPNGASNNDSYDISQGGARFDWGEGTKSRATFSGDYYSGNLGTQGTNQALTPPYAVTPYVGSMPVAGWNMLGKWDRDVSDRSSFSLQMFFDHLYRGSVTNTGQNATDTFDVDFQNQLTLSKRDGFIWGLGYRRYTVNYTNSPQMQGLNVNPSYQQHEIFSAFVHNDYDLARHLKLSTGIKVEHNDFTGIEVQPDVKLAYTPDLKRTYWASIARAVRTPAIYDRDLSVISQVIPPGNQVPLPIYVTFLGSKQIGSEKLVANEIGYRWEPTEKLFVDLTGFYNIYDHGFSIVQGKVPFPGPGGTSLVLPIRIGNANAGQTYGAELSVTLKATRDWKLVGAYSYLQSHLKYTDAYNDAAAPHNLFNLRSNLDLGRHWEFDTMLYVSDEIKSLKMPAYARVDVRLGNRPSKNLELSLAVYNLLNQNHLDYGAGLTTSVPVPRSVMGKATWRF